MKTVGLIPARLESSRLRRKLLLSETGQPLIQHTWQVAAGCPDLDEVIVATDSHEIAAAVEAFGGHAELTAEHPSGTDRIAEVVRRSCPDADIVVNIQGDEPELEPETISALVQCLKTGSSEMATVATPFHSAEAVRDPSCVKVVVNDRGEAMYFSRSPIPFVRDRPIEEILNGDSHPFLLHLGMYAFRRDFLLQMTQMPRGDSEQLECLEQLRPLQSGARIAVAIVSEAAIGIDTPRDYAAFVERMKSR